MTFAKFDQIQAEMDCVIATLKTTIDDEVRRSLLQHLRVLLLKADRLLLEPRNVAKSVER